MILVSFVVHIVECTLFRANKKMQPQYTTRVSNHVISFNVESFTGIDVRTEGGRLWLIAGCDSEVLSDRKI